MAATITTTFDRQQIDSHGMITGKVSITAATATTGDRWYKLTNKFKKVYGVVFADTENSIGTQVRIKYLANGNVLLTGGTDCIDTFFIATGE